MTNGKPSRPPYEEVEFVDTTLKVWNYSLFTEEDVANFQNGTHYRLYEHFGPHTREVLGRLGTYFAVWAPNATAISVKGPFNEWRNDEFPLFPRLDKSGIWEGFIPGLADREAYKYHITGYKGRKLDKGDPFAHYWEKRPNTASITWNMDYTWQDGDWMEKRAKHNALDAPWSVYELHPGSWMRPDPSDEESFYSYTELGERLVPYLQEMGFTHVEFMPVMEHPYDGSWGYQGTGFFAPTSRYGEPQGMMALVDALHQAGIGVILDWVPSHFPYDAHGLYLFDGAHTYEYADMRKGFHPDWNSYIFNYKRGEVKSFLISSARYWFHHFHIDGIRVDAVSSMIYLNYSRKEGEWEPNETGGDGNLEAIAFVTDLNATIYRDFPDVQTIAEEATNYQWVSRPTWQGGLGFGMKWMMGWMNDTLRYFKNDPLFRTHVSNQNKFTFSIMYAFNENFMLPFSHDEVVHGKSPMVYKMPGDEWQKFANLRLLYTYMFTHPGAKLLFMGNEFGQTTEWNHKTALNWDLLQFDCHEMLRKLVKDLNRLYRNEPALYEQQFSPYGFEWVNISPAEEGIFIYRRRGKDKMEDMIVALNVTPVPRRDYTFELSGNSIWKEVFNSDDKQYWGTGDTYNPDPQTEVADAENNLYRLRLHLPPLGGVVLKKVEEEEEEVEVEVEVEEIEIKVT